MTTQPTERFVLHAGYFDGAMFHTFSAPDFDAAVAYARNKGWAVDDFHAGANGGPNVIDVIPPSMANETERRLAEQAQRRNPDIIIHPVDSARGSSW